MKIGCCNATTATLHIMSLGGYKLSEAMLYKINTEYMQSFFIFIINSPVVIVADGFGYREPQSIAFYFLGGTVKTIEQKVLVQSSLRGTV